jgi:hypothetical protein
VSFVVDQHFVGALSAHRLPMGDPPGQLGCGYWAHRLASAPDYPAAGLGRASTAPTTVSACDFVCQGFALVASHNTGRPWFASQTMSWQHSPRFGFPPTGMPVLSMRTAITSLHFRAAGGSEPAPWGFKSVGGLAH